MSRASPKAFSALTASRLALQAARECRRRSASWLSAWFTTCRATVWWGLGGEGKRQLVCIATSIFESRVCITLQMARSWDSIVSILLAAGVLGGDGAGADTERENSFCIMAPAVRGHIIDFTCSEGPHHRRMGLHLPAQCQYFQVHGWHRGADTGSHRQVWLALTGMARIDRYHSPSRLGRRRAPSAAPCASPDTTPSAHGTALPDTRCASAAVPTRTVSGRPRDRLPGTTAGRCGSMQPRGTSAGTRRGLPRTWVGGWLR